MEKINYKGKSYELKFDFISILKLYENDLEPCYFFAPNKERGTTSEDFIRAWAWLVGEAIEQEDGKLDSAKVEIFTTEILKTETPLSLHTKAENCFNEWQKKRLALSDKTLVLKKKPKKK